MPLPVNLTTNEVKDRTGTEKQFLFFDDSPARTRMYALDGEPYNLPERIKVQHREVGKAGVTLRRQSNVLITKTVMATDGVTPVVIRASMSLDIPQGALGDQNAVKDTLAYMMAFIATTGAGTTVLFDGTGYGAAALINGTL
jgi:hypothetical protein